MKKILSLFVVISTTVSLSAQIVDRSKSIGFVDNEADSYQRVTVSYNNLKTSYDGGAGYVSTFFGGSENMSGISIGLQKGWKIKQTMPIFLESGVQMSINKGKYLRKYNTYNKETHTMLYADVPVNVVYKFNVQSFTLAPYVGLYGRYYIIGEGKRYQNNEHVKDISFFSKDDLTDPASRLGIGYQAGLGVNYNRYYLGVGYAYNFADFATNKISNTTLSLGYYF